MGLARHFKLHETTIEKLARIVLNEAYEVAPGMSSKGLSFGWTWHGNKLPHANVAGGGSENDSICLQLTDPNPADPAYGWCRRFEDLPESGGTLPGRARAILCR